MIIVLIQENFFLIHSSIYEDGFALKKRWRRRHSHSKSKRRASCNLTYMLTSIYKKCTQTTQWNK